MLRYINGEEIMEGDHVLVGKKKLRKVARVLEPQSDSSVLIGHPYPKGEIQVFEYCESKVCLLNIVPGSTDWTELEFVRRDTDFLRRLSLTVIDCGGGHWVLQYANGEQVMQGDRVQTWEHRKGTINAVMEPGSVGALACGCRHGGLFIEEEVNGEPIVHLMEAGSEEWWEMVLVERA